MRKLLVVVDMQGDFVTGSLGSQEAREIVDNVISQVNTVRQDGGIVVFTMDTHDENYRNTQEGRNLPVDHCLKDSEGWQLIPQLRQLAEGCLIFEKSTFGSTALAHYIAKENYDSIELAGVCTDICVISNAMIIKASAPETSVSVLSSCCAGVTPKSHEIALEAMKMCQIQIV